MTRPRTRRAVIAVGVVGLVAICLTLGYWQVFSRFLEYDDEGYLLQSLRSFVDGGVLYEDVYTQYGPFYYELFGGLFAGSGREVTMDAGRLVTLAVWVGSSIVAALAARRLTGSLLLAIAAGLIWFHVAYALTGEPMHPSGLVTLLLACAGAAAAMIARRPAAGFAALGLAIGATAMTKVNVGAFLALAALLAAALALRLPAGARVVAVGLAVAAPVALLWPDLGEPWARFYALFVTAGLVAIVIVGRAAPPASTPAQWGWLGALAAAAVGAVVVSIGAIVALGSPLGDVIDALFVRSRDQREATLKPLGIGSPAVTWSVVAVAAATAVARLRQSGYSFPAAGLVRIAGGVAIWLAVSGTAALQIGPSLGPMVLPTLLAWIAVVPPAGERGDVRVGFVRTFLPAAAVVSTLQAYPVAGTQVAIGALLFALVGAVCIADGARELARHQSALSGSTRPLAAGAASWIAAVLAAIAVVQFALEPLVQSGRNYSQLTPLPFASANQVRLSPQEVNAYREMVDAVRARCDTFVTLPGMLSFHEWSGKPPPTGLNATVWFAVLTDDEQQRVVDAMRRVRRPCAIRNRALLQTWLGAKTLPEGPLTRYINGELTTLTPYQRNLELLTP